MRHDRVTVADWELAKRHCTPRQLRALDYWRRGCTYRRISALLGISLSAAYDLVQRARRQVDLATPTRRRTR